jgi:hypothetical protein
MLLPPRCDALADRDFFGDPIQLGLNGEAYGILLGNTALVGEPRHQLRRCVVLDVVAWAPAREEIQISKEDIQLSGSLQRGKSAVAHPPAVCGPNLCGARPAPFRCANRPLPQLGRGEVARRSPLV